MAGGEVAIKYVGKPTGPMEFIKELGMEVPTFLEAPGGRHPALKHHVPLNMRGPYRPNELANYESAGQYRTDTFGYVMCGKETNAGEPCAKRAENRSGLCLFHGGRVHPLDKIVKESETAANEFEAQSLSRYQQFKAGQITVDDLDDEELASCGFRAKNGRIYKPRNVPRDLAQAFTKAIYERANKELKSHTVKAALTVAEIMMNKSVEPDIRLKAANTLLDRGLGKAPQTINVSAEITGFEEVFEGIFSGPRNQRPTIIDAEVVEPQRNSDNEPDSRALQQRPDIFDEIGAKSQEGQANPVESRDEDASLTDARLFERNPAILAQTVEIKPFEYDLSDHSDDIQKATRKRYAQKASAASDSDDNVAYVRIQLDNGMFRHVLPKSPKAPKRQSNAKASARKRYTLSDFD